MLGMSGSVLLVQFGGVVGHSAMQDWEWEGVPALHGAGN